MQSARHSALSSCSRREAWSRSTKESVPHLDPVFIEIPSCGWNYLTYCRAIPEPIE